LLVGQPVQRRIHLVPAGIVDAEVGGQGGVGPPAPGRQLRGGADHPGDQQRERHITHPPGFAQQAREPEPAGHGVHCGHMPVRPGPLHPEPFTGDHDVVAGQHRTDRRDRFRRQVREVRQRLVADLLPVPVGAAQQVRLVDPLPTILARVVTTRSRHMHRTTTLRHELILAYAATSFKDISVYTLAVS
jgi:hypothetical protein